MDIKELYSGKLLTEAVERLEKNRIDRDSPKTKRFITKVEGPEILSDSLLNEWLLMNYVEATDFKRDGSIIMGEIGGIIPTNPEDGKKVLAIAEASMISKARLGIEMIKDAERTGNENIISELEKITEMPLEYRGNITVVNGNRNIAHYDFTSSVAIENPFDLLVPKPYQLLGVIPFGSMSNKCLEFEQYVFNVPVNRQLSEKLYLATKEMDNVEEDEGIFQKRLDILKFGKDSFIPDNFIAGFHIIYGKDAVTVRPLLVERQVKDHLKYLKDKGVEPTVSDLFYLGGSSPNGEFGIIEKGTLI